MAFVSFNPRHRATLERHGLIGADDFLALPIIVVSGHPDRHVGRVSIGAGPAAVSAFLKREHRIPWKERLANAWAGFGLVAKSQREAALLQELHRAGVGCPEVLAWGEDDAGRAFLLVRELAGAVDLRIFLQRLAGAPARRRTFARALGHALAHVHGAGFNHPDLYSKHVLVGPGAGEIHLIDWQRSRRRADLPWRQRCRDLAALQATLADELASPRDRLACLRAYARCARALHLAPSLPASLAQAAIQVRRRSQRLQRRRRIRELCQPPLAAETQSVVWLDGEAICVTHEFHKTLKGSLPAWLASVHQDHHSDVSLSREKVPLRGQRRATLVRRRANGPLRWLWSWLCRRPLTSPELEQAGILFRLQRHGIGAPRLLAFGQRHPRPWQTQSFLLTEPPTASVRLEVWLAAQLERPLWNAERKQRLQVIRQAGRLVRRLHEASCYLHASRSDETGRRDRPGVEADCPLLVQAGPGQALAVVLDSVAGIGRQCQPSPALARRDLAILRERLPGQLLSRTDELRFLLAYLDQKRLTPAGRKLIAGPLLLVGRETSRLRRWARQAG